MRDVKEVAKKFIVLRNTFNFVRTYVKEFKRVKSLNVEDEWIISRVNSLVKDYLNHFKSFNGHKGVQELMDFILNDFSRWYVKLIRNRVWPLYEGKDKTAAFFTLVYVSERITKLLAPICPFFAEDIYQNVLRKFGKGLESIHMYELPKPEKSLMKKRLEEEMKIIKGITEVSYAARQKAGLKLRWPVKRLVIVTEDKRTRKAIENLKSVLLNACNSKEVEVVSRIPRGNFSEAEFEGNKVLVDLEEDTSLREERLYRELTRKIQALRKEYKFVVEDRIKLTLKSDEETERILRKFAEFLKKDVGAEKVEIGELRGKYGGELKFREKKIEIRFE